MSDESNNNPIYGYVTANYSVKLYHNTIHTWLEQRQITELDVNDESNDESGYKEDAVPESFFDEEEETRKQFLELTTAALTEGGVANLTRRVKKDTYRDLQKPTDCVRTCRKPAHTHRYL